MTDPKKRFTGLAEIYSVARPSYPNGAIDYIFEKCGLTEQSTIVDIGCGTGISTRLLAERHVKIVGIEPNDDMRVQAESTPIAPGVLQPTYLKGGAEATGLRSHRAQLVIAAQAFHWFQPEAAILEFCRILESDGWIALMWNERDPDDAFTRDYGTLLESFPDTCGVELNRAKSGNALLESQLVANASVTYFANSQTMDLEGLQQRALSSSYVPKEPPGRDVLLNGLEQIFERHQSGGTVTLHYKTSVYLGQSLS